MPARRARPVTGDGPDLARPHGRAFEVDAVLFDFDGVLVDSREATDRLWRAWAARHGLDGDAIMAVAHGRRSVELVESFAPHLDAAVEAGAVETRAAATADGVVAMPGAERLLRELAGHAPDRWAIVTSATHALVRARLAAARLSTPAVLVTAGDVARGKPAPDAYRLAARRLGVAPKHALVFEDAPNGVEAARAAGMDVIGITRHQGRESLSRATALIPDLRHVDLMPRARDPARRLRVQLS